jgi:hypothetical protein
VQKGLSQKAFEKLLEAASFLTPNSINKYEISDLIRKLHKYVYCCPKMGAVNLLRIISE